MEEDSKPGSEHQEGAAIRDQSLENVSSGSLLSQKFLSQFGGRGLQTLAFLPRLQSLVLSLRS